MTLDRFILSLDTYGADFRRWPDDLRRDGESLLATSPAARAKWETAKRLDTLFRLDRAQPTTDVRMTAILDSSLRRIRALPEPGFDWHWLFSKPAGAALATAVVAGLALGFVVGGDAHPPAADGPPAIFALLDYTAPDDGGPF